MNRQYVMQTLTEAPGNILTEEHQALAREQIRQQAELALKDKEAVLLLSGAIDGKNAEQRQAQLRQATTREREALERAEFSLQDARIRVRWRQNELSAAKAMARLIAGNEDD